jgi:type VI protein secretion system component Hcp
MAALTILVLPFLGLRTSGSVHAYLWLEGDFKGEVNARDYKDWIEVLSFSNWKIENSGTTHTGLTGEGRSTVEDLGLTKWIDRSSPVLALYCATGKHIPEGKLEFVEATFDGEFPVLGFNFKDVIITSYDVGGTIEGEVQGLSDSFNLNFREVEWTVFARAEKGAEWTSTSVTWDIAQQTGSTSTQSGGGGTPSNTRPTISNVPDQSVDEDGTLVVNFTVHDSQTADGALVVSRGSDNPALLPPSRMTLGGSGGTRSVTLAPVADQAGSAVVTLTVSDGSLAAGDTFILTVNPVNDAPGIAAIPAQVTDVDTPLEVEVTLADIDSSIDAVTLTGTADPPALVAEITDTTLTGATRTVRITPTPGAAGTANITLTANDGALGEGQATFSLTVNPAGGGGPSAVLLNGSDAATVVPLPENPPVGTEIGVLDAADPEPDTEHAFSILSPPGPFVIGGPDSDRLLVGDPAQFDFETSSLLMVTIQAVDRSDPARRRTDTFTIELTNVNERAAIFAPASFPEVPPETGTSLAGISVHDPDAGDNPIVFTISAPGCVLTIDDSGTLAGKVSSNGTDSVMVTAPQDDLNTVLAAGGLTLAGDPGTTGDITVSFATDDQGHTGPGGVQTHHAASSIGIVLSGWEQWRRDHFEATELANLLVSGFDADCDGDGLANGGEYGFGTNPKDGTSGPDAVVPSTEMVGPESYPAATFPRRANDPDLSMVVEVATDLRGWEGGLSFTEDVSITPVDADFEEVTVRTLFPLASSPEQQLRIRFLLDAP